MAVVVFNRKLKGEEERINEIKDDTIEITQQNKREKIDWKGGKKEKEQSLKDLWNCSKKLTDIP